MGLDSLPMHMRTPELDPLCVDIINGWPPYPFIKDNWISGLLIHPQYCHSVTVPRQFVYGHFVYDTSSTDISSTTVYQRTGQLYIQLLFQQIIIFIDSNFYLHYDSF